MGKHHNSTNAYIKTSLSIIGGILLQKKKSEYLLTIFLIHRQRKTQLLVAHGRRHLHKPKGQNFLT